MAAALLWGGTAAAPLVIGAVLGLVRTWPKRPVGLLLAFGAGALIAAVSFELAGEGVRIGGLAATAVGLAFGALTYVLLDEATDRAAARGSAGPATGPALVLGALLDGIPEQLVIGIGLAAGADVGVGLLVAVVVSNLPEATGSAAELREAGRSAAFVALLWTGVAVVCALATAAGHAVADVVSAPWKGGIHGFAAGAVLVMLIDSMIPDATARAGRAAGVATVVGFAVATGLSGLDART